MPRRSCFGLTAALALCAAVPALAAPHAEVVGSFVWTNPDPKFGGLSGFDLYGDGLRFRALTDRGRTIAGRLVRDGAGRVTAVAAERMQPLRDDKGVTYEVDAVNVDAEGLALGPGDSFYVSFEINHRVTFYLSEGAATYVMTAHENFRDLNINEGLEALAADAQGRLYAVAEYEPGGRPLPVWRFDGQRWDIPFHLPQDGNWRVSGGDIGPDGRLYLVERDFWGFVGFMTRVVRIDLAPGPHRREVLFQSRAGQHDNMESIAVWTDAAGAGRLTLVSDDNFMPFQRTEILDLKLVE
jgi:hypothetical protein